MKALFLILAQISFFALTLAGCAQPQLSQEQKDRQSLYKEMMADTSGEESEDVLNIETTQPKPKARASRINLSTEDIEAEIEAF